MSASSSSLIPGLVQLQSHHSVSATLDRLESRLRERGILVFARIDFSGDAGRAGYNQPEYVVQRYSLAASLTANLAAVVPLIEQAVAP
jgi:uncharacterized protein (DUF302 family)